MANKPVKDYLDTNVADLPVEAQEMLKQDRALYDQQKALRKRIATLLNDTLELPAGHEVTGIAFTRWGQFQLVIGEIAAPKATTSKRRTLADFLAQKEATGDRA